MPPSIFHSLLLPDLQLMLAEKDDAGLGEFCNALYPGVAAEVLDSVEPQYLQAQSASKGRTVGEQFAHLHNVRLMWLKVSAPDLMKGLDKIEKESAQDQNRLRKSLSRAAWPIRWRRISR